MPTCYAKSYASDAAMSCGSGEKAKAGKSGDMKESVLPVAAVKKQFYGAYRRPLSAFMP